MNYTATMDELTKRFTSKAPKGTEALGVHLKNLTSQLAALDHLQGDDKLRGVQRLNVLVEAAERDLGKVTTERGKSFDAELRRAAGFEPGPFGPELRARFASMAPGDRVKALNELVKAGDGPSLHAVLDSPSVLTGLDPDTQGKFREMFFQREAPDLYKARENFSAAVEAVHTAIRTAQRAHLELSDPRKLQELEEAEAARKEAVGEAVNE